MSIGPNEIFTWSGGAVAIIGLWYRNQYKVDRIEEKQVEQKKENDDVHFETRRQFEAFWKWKDTHEKEVMTVKDELNKETVAIRERLNVEIAQIRGVLLVTDQQFKQILEILTEIKSRLNKIEGTDK